ncbi:MAG: hypothetical protein M1835_005595 [Candelina submexicana]|nr:MAG: hypothetical protein M1835_005595 [Candelina submexicana]
MSIKSFSVPVAVENILSGRFAIQTNRNHSYGGQSNLEIYSDESCILVSDLRFEADHLIEQKPVLRTLYSKPVTLPDISRLSPCESMSISQCILLLTHKWPLSDIGLIEIASEDAQIILRLLSGVRVEERSRFRSAKIIGSGVNVISDRVQAVEQSGVDTKFHMIFVIGLSAERILDLLHPNGLACVKATAKCEEEILAKLCEKVCIVTGFGPETWTLWRRINMHTLLPSGQAVKLFAYPAQDISSFNCFPDAEHVFLEPSALRNFCKNTTSRYNAVVIDCIEKSVILTWPGQHLIPWLQHLVRLSDNILWISQHSSKTPYNNVAGNLLRTLQSEQPSINVTWLVVESSDSSADAQSAITSAYTALLSGENEVRLEVKDAEFRILRYLPDDELSAATGLLLPRSAISSLVGKDYELSLAAPQKPVILTRKLNSIDMLGNGNIRITVEASVIDGDDLTAFSGTRWPSCRRSELGMFFSGKVVSHNSRDYPFGSRVVGWYNGAHRRQMDISPKALQLCSEEIAPAIAAVSFAAHAAALCIVDGVTRARAGDTFKIHFEGILAEAIGKLCDGCGAAVLEHEVEASPDFHVSFGLLDGLQINGSAVKIDKYLDSHHGRDALRQAWEARKELATPIYSLQLEEFQRVPQITQEQVYSTALMHGTLEQVENTVALYEKPERLLSGEGAYVIIGGLGGLGRYICSWMVANGAKKLFVISRSGLNSGAAKEAFATINASGASMEVIRADACDQKAMTVALNRIRETCLIKGVINMAMLLGDAPLADLTGEQWDRALRLKVDSSWILHEETLQDELEFFIMFSSIASVLGNRNQAGYNVGNTFLNALAAYRQSLGLTAISIALGAMTEIGILHELGRDDLLQTLSRAGLSHLGKEELNKIMEAAITESRRLERCMILTGLEMFERVDGKIVGTIDQQQLYWTELPEFGFMQSHRLSDGKGSPSTEVSLREKAQRLDERNAKSILLDNFFAFLSELLGFPTSTFEPTSSLSMYGLDSLSAVSCQYWFHKELSIRMYICEIFDAPSIEKLMILAHSKLQPKEPEEASGKVDGTPLN